MDGYLYNRFRIKISPKNRVLGWF